MPWRILIVIAVAASVVVAVRAGDANAPPVASNPVTAIAIPEQPASVTASPAAATNQSCAADCQTHHDRCRIRTKGSPSCDSERQACLQKCLQKKPR